MERTELLTLFRDTVTEIAEKDYSHVEEDNVIAELGIDSLQILEMVGEMERELSIRLPDEELTGIETVRQLMDLIQTKQGA